MTATKDVVMLSINMPGNEICVDIFMRANGTFGFEEFRRDPEDARDWFPIGGYAHQTFDSFEEAKHAAQRRVGWLEDAL